MRSVATENAPNAIGPYSQAVVCDGWVFCSGQVGMNPGTSDFAGGDVAEQTRLVLSNLDAVLQAAGTSRERVVKTTVFLVTMDDFPIVNETYAEFFGEHKPARATIAVAGLPKGARVEIEAVARA